MRRRLGCFLLIGGAFLLGCTTPESSQGGPQTASLGQYIRGGVSLRLNEPRIRPIEETAWTEVERNLLAPIKQERGFVPNIYKTFARHPEMFTPRLNFGRYLQRESTLPARDREILINRIAWLSNAEYEWSAHTRIGKQNGLSDEDLVRIRKGPGAKGWSDFDAALVRAVDELYNDTFILDATWERLEQRYDTHQLIDLVMTVGGYHMLAMALNSFGVQLEERATRFPPRAGSGDPAKEDPGGSGRSGVATRLNQPRIAPLDEKEWTETEHELLAPIKEQRGYVPNVFGTLSRHPEMYRRWIAFARQVLIESSLPPREREMLINRIAWLSSGEYEWSAHNRLGKENGLTDEEILRLAEGVDALGWSEADATLLRAVDELHDRTFISDETWSPLRRRFDDRQLIDLVLTVGAYKMLAMALNSFGAQLDPGMQGFASG